MGMLLGALVPHPPVMIPEVGGDDARCVRSTRRAMKRLARIIRRSAPDTLVLITPHAPTSFRHSYYYGGKQLWGDLAMFGAPDAAVEWLSDDMFLHQLKTLAGNRDLSLTEGPADALDHGALVPLHFLGQAGIRCPAVVLSAPGWTREKLHELGVCIGEVSRSLGVRTVVLASGDLSHRLKEGAPAGYHRRGAAFDRAVMEALSVGDFEALASIDPDLIEAAGQCALNPLLVLGGALAHDTVKGQRLSYEVPFGVGYGVVMFKPSHPVVALATRAIWTYVRHGVVLEAPRLSDTLPEKAGVFVSLHAQGQLRGCIGTVEPAQDTLGHEIVHNAIAAATQDSRFAALTGEELPYVDVSVDILGPVEPVAALEHLDAQRYGVVVTKGARSGLLLPALPGVETAHEQLAIACQKAGLSPDDPCVKISCFEVMRYE